MNSINCAPSGRSGAIFPKYSVLNFLQAMLEAISDVTTFGKINLTDISISVDELKKYIQHEVHFFETETQERDPYFISHCLNSLNLNQGRNRETPRRNFVP